MVILGGGLAGLCLARQLNIEQPEIRVTVLEKSTFPVPIAAHKVGESSVEIGAHYFAQKLNLKEHIKQVHLPKYGLRFFFGFEDNSDISRRLEVGVRKTFPTPSYQFDRGLLENHLQELIQHDGAKVLSGARVVDVELDVQNGHQVTYVQEGIENKVIARWVVDASGRAGLLKRKLNWAKPNQHEVHAVWFRVPRHVKIDEWSQDTHWAERSGVAGKRWLSTNHLMGEGYWVWLIPLGSGSTSIGIVADSKLHDLRAMNSFDKAMDWLREHEPQCAQSISDDEPQDFLALKNFSYDAKHVFSADRVALTGEAGAFLDPFYSPGSDFIAISNTLVVDLIRRDAQGETIAQRTSVYDQIYLNLVSSTLSVYENQYPLFGHHQLMPIKIAWDYLTYWSLVGYLFFWDRLTDMTFMARHREWLVRAKDLNAEIQAELRGCASQLSVEVGNQYLDQSDLEVLAELNGHLISYRPTEDPSARFRRNIDLMEQAAEEIRQFCRGRRGPSEGLLTRLFDKIALSRPYQSETLT